MNIALFSDTYLPDINGVANVYTYFKKRIKKTWASRFGSHNNATA